MFAHITFIATYILSAFGLKALFDELEQRNYRLLLSVFGGGLLFLVIILMSKSSFAYVAPNELGRYNQQTLDLIKKIRMEFLTIDTMRVLILVGLTMLVSVGYLFRKVNKYFAIAAILVLVSFEVFSITNRQISKRNLVNEEQLEQTAFQQTSITQYLQSKDDNMRALALSSDFQSNYYAYFYPTINGYSAIKLQLIQDIIEHNLFEYPTPDKLNWNVINMLNGKYIISPNPLSYPFLTKVTDAQSRKEILYQNNMVLPKAWFVKSVKPFDSQENLVLYMNDLSFNPDSVALIVNSSQTAGEYSAQGTIEVTKYTPNEIQLAVNTNDEQFLVLSEVFYPKGWNAETSDGKELTIEQTNHILRGVKVPAGQYTLSFTFEPQIYFTSMAIVWIGNILIFALMGLGIFFSRRAVKDKNNVQH